MLFDTDIIIWLCKGNIKAAKLIDNTAERYMSILTRMELLQGAQNKEHLLKVESFIAEYEFNVLSLTQNIGHRALIYVEEYSLSHGLRANDAIIAASAVENNLSLSSANIKHYRPIKDLKFHAFKA
jgi:predicted nucleic acid-binding protein